MYYRQNSNITCKNKNVTYLFTVINIILKIYMIYKIIFIKRYNEKTFESLLFKLEKNIKHSEN